MATTAFPSEIAPLIETILATSRAQMTEGQVGATVYVINSGTGANVPVDLYVPNEVSKDIAASMVRRMVKNMKADVTIMAYETYTMSEQDTDRYHQIMEKYGSIWEYPGKIDILMLEVQTPGACWTGHAPIEDKGRARRCGTLEWNKADAGRCTNFLLEGRKPPAPKLLPPPLLYMVAMVAALFLSRTDEKPPVATPDMTATFRAKLALLVDNVMALCREQMTGGTVSAVTYVINSGERSMIPVNMYMPNEVSKDVAAALVRWTAKDIHADATVKVSEAWTLSEQDRPRYQEIVDEYGSISEYPGKLDILMVDVQTRAGQWIGRSVIETKGRARRCGPLEVTKADVGRTDFLSKDDTPG